MSSRRARTLSTALESAPLWAMVALAGLAACDKKPAASDRPATAPTATAPSPATAPSAASPPPMTMIAIGNRAQLDAVLEWVDYPAPQNNPGTAWGKVKGAGGCVNLGSDVVTTTKREDLDLDGDGTNDVIYLLDHDKLVDEAQDPLEPSLVVLRHGSCNALMGTLPAPPDKIRIAQPGKPPVLEADLNGYVAKLEYRGGGWQATALKVVGEDGTASDWKAPTDPAVVLLGGGAGD